MDTSRVYCYLNSQISFAWIKGVDKEFKTFVQNRVLEIRSKIQPDKWFYCRSNQNPADLITRVNIENLLNDIWIRGPAILFENVNIDGNTVNNVQNLPSFFLNWRRKMWTLLIRSMTHCESLGATRSNCKTLRGTAIRCDPLRVTASHCGPLRATASDCEPLRATASHYEPLRAIASQCEPLRATTSHYNTLRATASHCEPLRATSSHLDPSASHLDPSASHLDTSESHFEPLRSHSSFDIGYYPSFCTLENTVFLIV